MFCQSPRETTRLSIEVAISWRPLYFSAGRKRGCLLLCRFLDAGDLKASRTLDRTASKKHQGTKSRLVVRRWIGVRYGDLKAARSLGNLRGGGCDAGVGAAVR